jgi:hypothetical protein
MLALPQTSAIGCGTGCEIARDPERRSLGLPGSAGRYSLYEAGDGTRYRIVFVVDEQVQLRAKVPAIAVEGITPLGARPRR